MIQHELSPEASPETQAVSSHATAALRAIDAAEASRLLPDLASLLVDAVESGAGVNFMAGFTLAEAQAYWMRQIEGLAAGDRVWIVAEEDGALAGTVMCVFAPQPNQPFRAEISKMLVRSTLRNRGIGGLLMTAIEAEALKAGKSLLVLDTTAGSAGDRLYRRLGWTPFGTAPGYAYAPDGRLDDATFFFKQLAPTPAWRGGPGA
jgi:GNAT superfamily N-acetyltransferase